MPPAGPALSQQELLQIRRWIEAGAAEETPLGGRLSEATAPTHWAFLRANRPPVPHPKQAAWARNPIDAFVLARLECAGIRPSPEADRPTLIRRLTLDLHGLPPTADEVDAFLTDNGPNAYERLVDRLLSSTRYGERWGRHWLDLARYADSDGYEKDLARPFAYLYRDWVIDAINRDLPYDQFTIEQLAGDLLPNGAQAQKLATGFHRNTLKNREGGVDPEEDRVKVAVDRTNTTGTVWLGLTVGCAQCHSHKYDPISQREYFALYSFFDRAVDAELPIVSAEEAERHAKRKARFDEEHAPLARALAAYEQGRMHEAQAKWEAGLRLPDPAHSLSLNRILALPVGDRSPAQAEEIRRYFQSIDPEWQRLKKAVSDHQKLAPSEPGMKAAVLAENPTPLQTRLHVRGDFLRPGDAIAPGFLSALGASGGADSPSNRLDLAKWLVRVDNPLTARVAVNRVWQYLFGRGLVGTPNDFGTRGERPTHPELLDWLATEYPSPRLGWSQKRLIRLIVTSATYRQSSRSRPELKEKDPKNLLLARQNRYRPEAEVVRDLYLATSGLLNPTVGGPSVRPPLPADIAALGYAGSVKWAESKGADRYRRGMYIFYQRTVPYPMLATFDAPDSNTACTRRERSDTPLQALTLLNDPVFVECAQALGKRVLVEGPADPDGRVRFAFRQVLAREPRSTEAVRVRELLDDLTTSFRSDPVGAAKVAPGCPSGTGTEEAAAWVVVARTLLNLDEFFTRE